MGGGSNRRGRSTRARKQREWKDTRESTTRMGAGERHTGEREQHGAGRRGEEKYMRETAGKHMHSRGLLMKEVVPEKSAVEGHK